MNERTVSKRSEYKGDNYTYIQETTRHKKPVRFWMARSPYTRKMKKQARVIAEAIMGRELSKTEIVHHIDFNPLNDSKDNLLLCDNSYHTWLHNQYPGFGF